MASIAIVAIWLPGSKTLAAQGRQLWLILQVHPKMAVPAATAMLLDSHILMNRHTTALSSSSSPT